MRSLDSAFSLLIFILKPQTTLALSASSLNNSSIRSSNKMRKVLPKKLLVGYTYNHCEDLDNMQKVTNAVNNGVNVVIWMSNSFVSYKDKNVQMYSKIQIDNYIMYKKQLRDMGHDVFHHIAFGGWNSPHLPSGFTSTELYDCFRLYNMQHDTLDEPLFDGIDWDLEGHDDIQSPNNEFTLECLIQMGEFSQLAKDDGLIVSMAPPESYLDITNKNFSRFVNLTYPEPWHQDFQYHGWNVYAYLLARWYNAFDFIFLQFYESYSHAAYQIYVQGQNPSDFLISYVEQLVCQGQGLEIYFENDESIGLKNQFVQLPLQKLVFGFANGWALNSDIIDNRKVIFFSKDAVKITYEYLVEKNIEPRGLGFWVIDEEGKNGITHYARDLNEILVRSIPVLSKAGEAVE